METQVENGSARREPRGATAAPDTPQDVSRGGAEGDWGTSTRRHSQGGELQTRGFDPLAHLSREMENLWDSYFARGFGLPRRLFGGWPFERSAGEGAGTWMPRIDMQQRGEQLVLHADLPGVRKEDIHLEATPEGIALSGERRSERQEGGPGQPFQLKERSWGSFYRNIPLPEGAKADQATARMADGVLEVTIPLQPGRSRRIPIE